MIAICVFACKIGISPDNDSAYKNSNRPVSLGGRDYMFKGGNSSDLRTTINCPE